MTLIFHSRLQLNCGICVLFLRIGLDFALMTIWDNYNISKLGNPNAVSLCNREPISTDL